MQDTVLASAGLIYSGAAVRAWAVLPGPDSLKLQRTALFPGVFLALCLAGALGAPVLRKALTRHLWISYRTGFGQSVISVLGGVGVLVALAGLIFWQIHQAAHGGRYPAGAFSGYAAGIGVLAAQCILVRRIEADPVLRARIDGQE
ncbi:MAG TPA: hypothetical protein VG248_11850 [Caulobacteraceae bacterium]|nr:hypothetical protein [Caulobacteraceae bacterium]